MHFASSRRRRINSAALNMSSMIDVTFLLLIYFIVSTVLADPESQVVASIKIEQGSEVDTSFLEPQIITVTSINTKPCYKVGNQQLTSRAQLATLLASLFKEPGVVIKVVDGVPAGFAVAAIQEARKAGYEKVTYVPATQ